MWSDSEKSIFSADHLTLPGTLRSSSQINSAPLALLIHGGGGVDRHEDGFFDRLSDVLQGEGIPSLRFDHRAYLATKDKDLVVTIAGIANDISAYVDFGLNDIGASSVHLVAASFGGGATALVAADRPGDVTTLTLLNPLLDYRSRLLEEKKFWRNGKLTQDGEALLRREGYLPHGSTLQMTRPLINEVVRFDAPKILSAIAAPLLVIHGTADSRISHEHSARLVRHCPTGSLELIEGADHGFALPGDDDFEYSQTLAWQSQVFKSTADWIMQKT